MKTRIYKGSLILINLKADNEEEALTEFWKMVNEDGQHLSVIIEEMGRDSFPVGEDAPGEYD